MDGEEEATIAPSAGSQTDKFTLPRLAKLKVNEQRSNRKEEIRWMPMRRLGSCFIGGSACL